MRKIILALAIVAVIGACNDNESDAEMKDPAGVQPPQEAIPDTTKIMNDSVIVPDSAN